MFYQIKSYIKFLFKSTNAHGIHSPFVYDLVTKCFYDKKQYSEYSILQNVRKTLENSGEEIEITDFGAGSRVFKSNKRKVSAIAKNAGVSSKRQKLLFRLVQYLKLNSILELGTSVGLATTAMALGNSKTEVITLEGCTNTSKVASTLFEKFQMKNISLKNEKFETFFKENKSLQFDLVYVDGNHDKENTLSYFHELKKRATHKTVLIFDDIYWSEQMTEAWQEISSDQNVTVSIDTYYWGLVFFKEGQVKEHFVVRV